MPLLDSAYEPRGLFRNAHASTVIPSMLRRVLAPSYVRERLDLADGDFVDLDWLQAGVRRLAVLCHGLEGDSSRPYMRGMARALTAAGWDVAAYNFRGCSGEPNRSSRTYHSGATDDLREVLAHAMPGYDKTALVGFSLGGNLVLKYLGEEGAAAPVAGAMAISVPVDLADACAHICSPSNRLYHDRFMRKLKKKIRAKAAAYPGTVDPAPLARVRDLREFDDAYTAPLHGFRDAADYYARCSSLPGLGDIRVPALLLTAANDPLLGDRCYPREVGRKSTHLNLEIADHGGHTGWYVRGGTYYSERRTVEFLEDQA